MKKRRGNLSRCVLLLHDNAPGHTSQVAMVLPHPMYSPDLAPLNFYPFPNLKANFRGSNFGSKDAVVGYLGDQEEGFYFEMISKLKEHWRKYIEAKGDFIEK